MEWQLIILQIRREYKTLTKVSPLVGLSADRLRRIARRGTKNMLWENGDKLIKLHQTLKESRGFNISNSIDSSKYLNGIGD